MPWTGLLSVERHMDSNLPVLAQPQPMHGHNEKDNTVAVRASLNRGSCPQSKKSSAYCPRQGSHGAKLRVSVLQEEECSSLVGYV